MPAPVRLKDEGGCIDQTEVDTKIAVVTDTGGFGADGQSVLKAEAPKAGITILSEQTFNPGGTDMTSQLTKIKGTNAQAVVMWSGDWESLPLTTTAFPRSWDRASRGVRAPVRAPYGRGPFPVRGRPPRDRRAPS